MKRYMYLLAITTTSIFCSCQPRVEMDFSQWGDKAFITNVQIFSHEKKDDFQLAEYHDNDGKLTTGIRRFLLTGTEIDINNNDFVFTISIPSGNDLSKSGFLITHTSTLVEPLDGSPKGGIIADLSSASFQYRLHSADGTTHDWKINIVEL